MKEKNIALIILIGLSCIQSFFYASDNFSFFIDDHYFSVGNKIPWVFLEIPFMNYTKYIVLFLLSAIFFSLIDKVEYERLFWVVIQSYWIEFVGVLISVILVGYKLTGFVYILYLYAILEYLLQGIYIYMRFRSEIVFNRVAVVSCLFVLIVAGERIHYLVYDYYSELY